MRAPLAAGDRRSEADRHDQARDLLDGVLSRMGQARWFASEQDVLGCANERRGHRCGQVASTCSRSTGPLCVSVGRARVDDHSRANQSPASSHSSTDRPPSSCTHARALTRTHHPNTPLPPPSQTRKYTELKLDANRIVSIVGPGGYMHGNKSFNLPPPMNQTLNRPIVSLDVDDSGGVCPQY